MVSEYALTPLSLPTGVGWGPREAVTATAPRIMDAMVTNEVFMVQKRVEEGRMRRGN